MLLVLLMKEEFRVFIFITVKYCYKLMNSWVNEKKYLDVWSIKNIIFNLDNQKIINWKSHLLFKHTPGYIVHFLLTYCKSSIPLSSRITLSLFNSVQGRWMDICGIWKKQMKNVPWSHHFGSTFTKTFSQKYVSAILANAEHLWEFSLNHNIKSWSSIILHLGYCSAFSSKIFLIFACSRKNVISVFLNLRTTPISLLFPKSPAKLAWRRWTLWCLAQDWTFRPDSTRNFPLPFSFIDKPLPYNPAFLHTCAINTQVVMHRQLL